MNSVLKVLNLNLHHSAERLPKIGHNNNSYDSNSNNNIKVINELDIDKKIYLTRKNKIRPNCSNTKTMFFTEDMEYVNNLKLTDPNIKNTTKSLIEANDTQTTNFDISTKMLQSFTESK